MESVAVIVPIYNSSRFLRECVESILAQTYPDLEILLINDGSTDNSLEIMQEYATKDSRIQIYTLPNGGVSVARNTGIKLARSEYLMFVDSDDVISPSLVEKLIDGLMQDFVMCGYETRNWRTNEQRSFLCPEFDGKISSFCNRIIDYLIPPYLLGPCFKLFRKSIIDKYNVKFPSDLSYGEDAEFVLDYLEHVKTVKCLNFIGYTYRQHDSTSLSRRFRNDKMDIYKRIARHILALLDSNDAAACIDKVYSMYIQNYVEFSKELFISSLKYREKKELFFESGTTNAILNCTNKVDKLSAAQKMIVFSLKHRIFLPAYLVFRMYRTYLEIGNGIK